MLETKTDLKLAILYQLSKGKENAIKGDTLAQRLNEKQTRAIRLAIEKLIREGFPICSTPHQPYGYYLAAAQEEVDESLRILRYGYGRKLYQHYTALRKAGIKAFGKPEVRAGQLTLL